MFQIWSRSDHRQRRVYAQKDTHTHTLLYRYRCGSRHCHKLLDICNDFSLNQINDKPTRLGSILELHLINNPSLVRNCSISPGFSDHDGMIVTDTDIQPVFNKSPPRKVPLYKSAYWNLNNEKAELLKHNYLLSCKSSSVETNWMKIKTFVQNIM